MGVLQQLAARSPTITHSWAPVSQSDQALEANYMKTANQPIATSGGNFLTRLASSAPERFIGNLEQKAGKAIANTPLVQSFRAPAATPAQRSSLISAINTAKSQNISPATESLLKQASPTGHSQAIRMIAGGTPEPKTQTFLRQDIKQKALGERKMLGTALTAASFGIGGGELAGLPRGANALKTAVEGAAIGGTGTAGAQLQSNGKINPTGVIEGAAAGAGLGMIGSALGATLARIKTGLAERGMNQRSALDNFVSKVSGPTAKTEQSGVAEATGGGAKSAAARGVNVKLPSLKPLGEEGGVTAAPVQNAQDLIAKHKTSVEFNGDVRKYTAASEGSKNNLLNDAAKITKARTQLTPEEKTTIQDYRDAKMNGKTPPELTPKLQRVNDEATAFAKAKNEADIERAKLEGNLQKAKQLKGTNVDSYTHRIAQGKGGAFDYVLQGDRKNPLQIGMGKTTSADKARNMFSVTDENGNTKVVSIKTQSGKTATGQKFTKPNQVVGFENGKPTGVLGSLNTKSRILGKEFKGADGHTYTVGQAGASDITKATGTKYFTDPYLTNQAAYLESRTALENARLFDNIKKSPLSEKIMSPPEETAPKGWKPVSGLDQFRGYKFEPRVAEAMHDIFVRGGDTPEALDKISQKIRQTIVYFPVKHDFNILSSYMIDRGLSGLANPLAAKRGISSLIQAAQDISHNTEFYQQLAKKGFELTTNDRTAFDKVYASEISKLVEDKPELNKIAEALKTKPGNLYKAMQRLSVWDVQDAANIARVRERMASGMSMDEAIKQTERFSFQYKVPERVAGSRTASQALQSKIVFFGKYRYDQYKIIGNIMRDALKVSDPKQAAEAWDKMAALLVGTFVAWPLVNKGVQAITGDKNAYVTAPGPMQLPELANKVRTGREGALTAAGNQVYIGPLQATLDVKNNTDSFTGKKIYDPNASGKQQGLQIANWVRSQVAPTQKLGSLKNASGNPVASVLLSMSGVNLPKNSPLANKLNSLKYDTLPGVQNQARAAAAAGDYSRAQSIIDSYDQGVLKAARADLQSKNVPVPPTSVLAEQLKKSGIYYAPRQSTILGWGRPKKAVPGSFTP